MPELNGAQQLSADDHPREHVDHEAKYTTPSQQRKYVKSPAHSRLGASR